jgi:hypothetical protein
MEFEAEKNAERDAHEVVATDVYIRDEFLPATADSYTW